VTRLRLEVSGAIFEHFVFGKGKFSPKTPDHVNKPLACFVNNKAMKGLKKTHFWSLVILGVLFSIP